MLFSDICGFAAYAAPTTAGSAQQLARAAGQQLTCDFLTQGFRVARRALRLRTYRAAIGDTAGMPRRLANLPEVAEAPEERPGSCGWPTTSAPSDRA